MEPRFVRTPRPDQRELGVHYVIGISLAAVSSMSIFCWISLLLARPRLTAPTAMLQAVILGWRWRNCERDLAGPSPFLTCFAVPGEEAPVRVASGVIIAVNSCFRRCLCCRGPTEATSMFTSVR